MFYLQHEEVKLVRQTLVYFGECVKLHKTFSSFVPVVAQMIFSEELKKSACYQR